MSETAIEYVGWLMLSHLVPRLHNIPQPLPPPFLQSNINNYRLPRFPISFTLPQTFIPSHPNYKLPA